MQEMDSMGSYGSTVGRRRTPWTAAAPADVTSN